MNSRYIYPDIISSVLSICEKVRQGLSSNDEFQNVVQRAEQTIIALEERDVRDFMTDIEGRLELIKFTVDDDLQVIEGQRLAHYVIEWINSRGVS